MKWVRRAECDGASEQRERFDCGSIVRPAARLHIVALYISL